MGIAGGMALLISDQPDPIATPAFSLLALALLAATLHVRMETAVTSRSALALIGLLAVSALASLLLPKWLYGLQLNAIISRTAITSPLLLVLSTAVCSHSLRALLGNTPGAGDKALYPWLILPIFLVVLAYGLIFFNVVVDGLHGLSLDLLTRAYDPTVVAKNVTANTQYSPVPGLRNQILGSLLLLAMSLSFAALPGIGAGVFMAEYPGRIATVISLSLQMLRAISLFVIGAAAYSMILGMTGTPGDDLTSKLVRGVSLTSTGLSLPERGSFLLVSGLVALVVAPVIAKMTEEGLRSVPRELREASVALGAGDGFGLRRVLLPWAGPNILTGLLIAAAETSASLAIIIFFAGTGETGVGPVNGVTTLDFAIFASHWGGGGNFFATAMNPYHMTAALLLIVLALGMTVASMLMQRRMGRRARGSLTAI
jgi:phosphate transport system permease protein